MKRRFSLFWRAFFGLVACTSPPLWEGVTPIGEIRANPEKYEGREVVVLAYYRGWDLFGEARTGPPLTRSDVAVADPTGGIYIVPGEGFEGFQGAPPLPPHRPTATDTLLWIRGVVRFGLLGQPYIEVREGKAVEGLPLGIVLRVRFSGTVAGFDEELSLYADGNAYYLDRKTGHHGRFSVDQGEVTQVLNLVGEYLGEVGAPFPDAGIYEFTFWKGEKIQTLWVFVGPEESPLDEALRIVAQWFSSAREKLEPTGH